MVYAVPRYASTNPLVYISLTSICGAFLVNAAQGFGSSFIYSIVNWNNDNQFRYWGMYPLIGFICIAVVFQIIYLNKALAAFSTSIVTPLNFVFFSTTTLITSAVLYQGIFHLMKGFNVSSVVSAVSIIIGFLVIVSGVALLFQYNLKLNKLQQAFEEGLTAQMTEPEPEINPIAILARSGSTLTTGDTFRSAKARHPTSLPMNFTNPELFVNDSSENLRMESILAMNRRRPSAAVSISTQTSFAREEISAAPFMVISRAD